MKAQGRGQSGFTLLEILVALVVLGFLMLGLAQGVRFGLRAWDLESALVTRRADMDAVERLLRSMIASADPGDPSDPPPFTGHPHTLAFVGRLPVSADSGLVSRDAAIGLGVDARHRLLLRWSPRPHAERLAPPVPPTETVLLEGLDHIDFSYERRPEQGGGWVDTWEQPTLPLLVKITLGFPGTDRRHWPTIEAAPMLSRIDQ
jgi:general secretion pathway protein J